MSHTALIQLNAIEKARAEAKSIDAITNIRNQAEAARQCFRLAEYGLEMQNNAAEVKLRAERRAGGMLHEMDRADRGRPSKMSHRATLSNMGVSRDQSSRWQEEAGIPEEAFERHVAETKAAGTELTSAGVIRLAKKLKQTRERKETERNALIDIPTDTKYKAIVIDPPWPVQKIIREVRPNQDRFAYPTMTIEEIAKLPIQDLADESGCHIYLWVTQKYLPQGLELFNECAAIHFLCTGVRPTPHCRQARPSQSGLADSENPSFFVFVTMMSKPYGSLSCVLLNGFQPKTMGEQPEILIPKLMLVYVKS